MHLTDCSLAWKPSHDLETMLLFDIQHVCKYVLFLYGNWQRLIWDLNPCRHFPDNDVEETVIYSKETGVTVENLSTLCFKISAITIALWSLNLSLLILAQVSAIIYDNWDTVCTLQPSIQALYNLSCWHCFWIRMSCIVYLWCWGLNPCGRQVHKYWLHIQSVFYVLSVYIFTMSTFCATMAELIWIFVTACKIFKLTKLKIFITWSFTEKSVNVL